MRVALIVFAVLVSTTLAFATTIDVTDCMTLDTAGATYVLQNNLLSTETCIDITANNITLDGNGYELRYGNQDSATYFHGIRSDGFSNLHITNFSHIAVGPSSVGNNRRGISILEGGVNVTVSDVIFGQQRNSINFNANYSYLHDITFLHSSFVGIAFNGKNNTVNNLYSSNSPIQAIIGTFHNSTITNVNFTGGGNNYRRIWLISSSNNYFENITIDASQTAVNGIALATNAQNNYFKNVVISRVGFSCVDIGGTSSSRNNVFDNLYCDRTSWWGSVTDVLRIRDRSHLNEIRNFKINFSNVNKVAISLDRLSDTLSGNTFVNGTIVGDMRASIELKGSAGSSRLDHYFINVTYDDAPTFTSDDLHNLHRQWYVQTNTSLRRTQTPLDDVTVVGTDVHGINRGSGVTTSATTTFPVTEYIQSDTDVFNQSNNYTFFGHRSYYSEPRRFYSAKQENILVNQNLVGENTIQLELDSCNVGNMFLHRYECEDMCHITTPANFYGHSVQATGSGQVNTSANIRWWNSLSVENTCQFQAMDGAVISSNVSQEQFYENDLEKYQFFQWVIDRRKGTTHSTIRSMQFELMTTQNSLEWSSEATSSNPGGSHANVANLIDNDLDTVWIDDNFGGGTLGESIVTINAGEPVAFDWYRFRTSNTGRAHIPTGWRLYASKNGYDWELIHNIPYAVTPDRLETWTQPFAPRNISTNEHRFLRWNITERKSTGGGGVQATEFQLTNDGSGISWNQHAMAMNPDGAFASWESWANIVDNVLTNKGIDTSFGSGTTGLSSITIDTGFFESLEFDGYRYMTGNDATHRDPVSWRLYSSPDGETWTLLDEVNGATITNSRQTWTQVFDID